MPLASSSTKAPTDAKENKMNITASPITACTECGSAQLSWQSSIVNRSSVQQGRLNTSDVECLFFLGCDECSETLATVSADKVASMMNAKQAVAA
jgi:hypothetical protein